MAGISAGSTASAGVSNVFVFESITSLLFVHTAPVVGSSPGSGPRAHGMGGGESGNSPAPEVCLDLTIVCEWQ